jgi:hypothetical protein
LISTTSALRARAGKALSRSNREKMFHILFRKLINTKDPYPSGSMRAHDTPRVRWGHQENEFSSKNNGRLHYSG